MIGHIDEPVKGSKIYTTEVICRGWVYSENGVNSIKIFIDNQIAGEAKYRLSRDDVKTVFPRYSGIEKSGFMFSKNLTLVKGLHRLKVVVHEKNGSQNVLGEVTFKRAEWNIFNSPIFSSVFTRHFFKNFDLKESSDPRKRISSMYLRGNGIEIGALHNPLPTTNDAKVSYVDRLPSVELQKQYPEINPYQMVSVDIVENGETLSAIPDNSLDFIIANHFLEHCENPIGTIRNHLKKIKTGGILFYAIPEKTCTFDHERSLTEFDHLIEDDTHDPAISRKKHFYEWVTFVENKQGADDIDSHVSELIAMDYSIHFHVWDIATVFQFLQKTNEYLGNPFNVLHFEQNGIEIITILQKK